ncbi:hypothetical protein VCHENC01_2985A, partial [Vibrio harveyi]
MTTTSRSKQ